MTKKNEISSLVSLDFHSFEYVPLLVLPELRSLRDLVPAYPVVASTCTVYVPAGSNPPR